MRSFKNCGLRAENEDLHWLAGLNYEHDIVFDEAPHFFDDS